MKIVDEHEFIENGFNGYLASVRVWEKAIAKKWDNILRLMKDGNNSRYSSSAAHKLVSG